MAPKTFAQYCTSKVLYKEKQMQSLPVYKHWVQVCSEVLLWSGCAVLADLGWVWWTLDCGIRCGSGGACCCQSSWSCPALSAARCGSCCCSEPDLCYCLPACRTLPRRSSGRPQVSVGLEVVCFSVQVSTWLWMCFVYSGKLSEWRWFFKCSLLGSVSKRVRVKCPTPCTVPEHTKHTMIRGC